MTRKHNTALARNPHLYHVLYGCSYSGHHAQECGNGESKSAKARRARKAIAFESMAIPLGKKNPLNWVFQALKIGDSAKSSLPGLFSSRRKTGGDR